MLAGADPIADVFVFRIEKFAAEGHSVPSVRIDMELIRNILL